MHSSGAAAGAQPASTLPIVPPPASSPPRRDGRRPPARAAPSAGKYARGVGRGLVGHKAGSGHAAQHRLLPEGLGSVHRLSTFPSPQEEAPHGHGGGWVHREAPRRGAGGGAASSGCGAPPSPNLNPLAPPLPVNWLPAYGSSRLPSRSPHARVRTQWRTAGLRPKATPTDAALAGGCQNLEVTCHAPLPAAAPRLSTRGGCPWAEQWSAEKASAGSPRKEPASDPSAARGAAPTSPMRPPAPAPAALCEEELEVEDLDLDALEAEVNNVPQQLQDKVWPSSVQA
jgi:hypothetical protein